MGNMPEREEEAGTRGKGGMGGQAGKTGGQV